MKRLKWCCRENARGALYKIIIRDKLVNVSQNYGRIEMSSAGVWPVVQKCCRYAQARSGSGADVDWKNTRAPLSSTDWPAAGWTSSRTTLHQCRPTLCQLSSWQSSADRNRRFECRLMTIMNNLETTLDFSCGTLQLYVHGVGSSSTHSCRFQRIMMTTPHCLSLEFSTQHSSVLYLLTWKPGALLLLAGADRRGSGNGSGRAARKYFNRSARRVYMCARPTSTHTPPPTPPPPEEIYAAATGSRRHRLCPKRPGKWPVDGALSKYVSKRSD